MLVQEMHIGVNQILRKVYSQATDSYEPEELDWALNEECLRYIRQRINPLSNSKRQGFQDTKKRYDDLAELITPAKLSSLYEDDDSMFCFLPQDYLHIINSRSLLKDLCSSPINSVGYVPKIYKICIVPFPDPVEVISPFYNNLQFIRQDNNAVLFDVNNYNSTVSGISSKAEKFYIINLGLEKINKISTDMSVVWETFDGNYYPNSLVFISSNPAFTGIKVNPSGIIYPIISKTYNTYNIFNPKEVDNRLSKTEDLYTVLTSNFATTSPQSPISSMSRGKLIVHHKQKFILSFVKIDYIRKPRKIDLLLNQSCELHPNVHGEIVENTAKRLAAFTKADNYKEIINENLIIE